MTPLPAFAGAVLLAAASFCAVGAFVPQRSVLSVRRRGTTLAVGVVSTASAAADVRPEVVHGANAPVLDSKGEAPASEFDWYKSWYPIVPVEYLDAERPQAFQLLGMDLVVWNDGKAGSGAFEPKTKKRSKWTLKRNGGSARSEAGSWRVFADECPHRKVPLSEGRVEDDGTLLCSYHAWRFRGDGEVESVPQAREGGDLEKVRANPKSRCNAFPAKVVNGLLWVWPESGSDAVLESELTPVPVMPLPNEVDDSIEEERVFLASWNFRQLPYGHDYFIENVVDPAHVPSSHHNIVGDRYNGPKPLTIATNKPLSKSGFSIMVSQDGAQKPSTTEFVAPSLVQITQPIGNDGARTILELYSSPSTPGFCNHIGRQVIVKTEKGEVPSFLKQFLLPLPLWILHLLSNTFLNQDALFLHTQERKLHERGVYSTVSSGEEDKPDHYTKAILPISADRGVLNFRNWMRTKAGGRIPYRGNPTMPPVSNEAVFDIYNSHTKHCKYCTDALRRLRKVRYAAYISAALLAAVRPKFFGVVGSTALAAVCGGVGIGTNKLMKMMNRMDYSHSEND